MPIHIHYKNGQFSIKMPTGAVMQGAVQATGEWLLSSGPAKGKDFRSVGDRDEVDDLVLRDTLKDASTYTKWRTWAKAKAAADGVTPPSDSDLAGGTLNTQVSGLQKLWAEYVKAEKTLDANEEPLSIHDLAADWNANGE